MRMVFLLAGVTLLSGCMGGVTVLGNFDDAPGGNGGPVPVQPVLDSDDGPIHNSFALVLNDERAENGVRRLTEHVLLDNAALAHAQDMVDNNYLSHTSQDGRSPGDRARAAGYNWNFIAENIAQGFHSNEDVVDAWMRSPGHRTNMVDPRAEDFGLGRVGSTWVLMLGREAN